MNSSEFPPTIPTEARIDRKFLLRQFPMLIHVKLKRRTWDEHGAKVARELLSAANPHNRITNGGSDLAASTWNLAKELVHAAITTENPEHAAIRKRLGDWRNRPTPALFSALRLWMAGVLGISVTTTGAMLAAMLYGVADAKGNWEILRELSASGRK